MFISSESISLSDASFNFYLVSPYSRNVSYSYVDSRWYILHFGFRSRNYRKTRYSWTLSVTSMVFNVEIDKLYLTVHLSNQYSRTRQLSESHEEIYSDDSTKFCKYRSSYCYMHLCVKALIAERTRSEEGWSAAY